VHRRADNGVLRAACDAIPAFIPSFGYTGARRAGSASLPDALPSEARRHRPDDPVLSCRVEAAAKYIDVFFEHIRWEEVERRFVRATKAWQVLQG
jgi:hypothetical protein